MDRSLQWVSLGAGILAVVLDFFQPDQHSLFLLLASLSLVLAALDLVFDPKRAIFFLSFLPALPLALAVLVLHDSHSHAPFVGLLLATQGRLLFVRAGKRAREKNLAFAKDLRGGLPERAIVFVDMDIEGETPLASLQEGHLIRIRPGDVIPVDGQLTFGSSFVDESPLTGDREPKTKSMGSFVYAGTQNKNGSFIYRASADAEHSFACRLASALEKGFPYESLFTPSLFLVEGMLFLGALAMYFVGSTPAILNAFLVSSGAALAVSAWVRDSSFLARSCGEGITWKSKDSVTRTARAGTVVSGPWGVLTEGKVRLSAIQGSDSISEDGALSLLGPLARRLENEIAFALLQELQTRNIRLEMVEAFSLTPGGASGVVEGDEVRLLDLETARVENLPLARMSQFIEERLLAGENVQLLYRNATLAAVFSFSDKISVAASQGVAALRRENVPYVLVTAEASMMARRFEQELDLSHIHSECGSKEAERLLERLEGEGLSPLWIASPGWEVANRGGATILPASLPGKPADVTALRWDLTSIAKVLRLARLYTAENRFSVRCALFSQLALLAFCAVMDPRLAALLGLLPGWWLLSRARGLLTK